MFSCGEGRFQTGVSGYQTPISTRLRILSLNRFTLHSVPPRQPPYPACELQEWKTGALGGHHWGNWGSQGKGQDPDALVTETRSVPVRLPLSTPDTTKPLPFGTQVQNSVSFLAVQDTGLPIAQTDLVVWAKQGKRKLRPEDSP